MGFELITAIAFWWLASLVVVFFFGRSWEKHQRDKKEENE